MEEALMTAAMYTLDDSRLTVPRRSLPRTVEVVPVGRRLYKQSATASAAKVACADWIDKTTQQISRLMTLEADWDSYGAVPIQIDAAGAMLNVLQDVMAPNTPAPTIVPSPAGHLQAEWHTNQIDLEVEVIDPRHIHVDYAGPDGSWSDVLDLDVERLTRAIDRLSAR
jgi:hypothetical protein